MGQGGEQKFLHWNFAVLISMAYPLFYSTVLHTITEISGTAEHCSQWLDKGERPQLGPETLGTQTQV